MVNEAVSMSDLTHAADYQPEATNSDEAIDHRQLRESSLNDGENGDDDLEDGPRQKQPRIEKRPGIWSYLTGRHGMNCHDVEYEDIPEEDGLLQNAKTPRRLENRKKSRALRQCLTAAALIGVIALVLILLVAPRAKFFSLPFSHDDRPKNWGQPGTGTENLPWYPEGFTDHVVPIPCHAHNDYWHKLPLFSAIIAGCEHIEADVWMFNNELYVGHNIASLTKERTFQSLYVNPLVKILEHRNKKTDFFNGTAEGIFEQHPTKPLILLVDIKSDGGETWPLVSKQLQPLRDRDWLSFVEKGKRHWRPITIIAGGKAPFEPFSDSSTYRDAFFDAPLGEMWEAAESMKGSPNNEKKPPKFNKSNSYSASTSFKHAIGKVVNGELSEKQLGIIRGQLRGAHRRGLKARYWETPEWPLKLRNHVWDVLMREGVDTLNVDDLKAASELLW